MIMAETLSVISTVSFMVSGVFAVIAAAVWFLFKIPSVIGDLSGRTARKSIERMRINNERSGDKPNLFHAVKTVAPTIMDETPTAPLVVGGEVTSFGEENETLPLMDDNATEILNTLEKNVAAEKRKEGIRLSILDEMILIHTNEEI